MATLRFDKLCRLRRDDGTEVVYLPGVQIVEEIDAGHWYVKAHLAKTPPPSLGDHEFARAARAHADMRKAAWEDADRAAVAAEEAFHAKHTPAPPAPAGDAEGDGGKPDPATTAEPEVSTPKKRPIPRKG